MHTGGDHSLSGAKAFGDIRTIGVVSLDGLLRYVGALENTSTPTPTSGSTRVPAYTDLGLRLSHRLRPGLELGLTGSNLLDRRHAEFGASATRSEMQRSIWAELRWSGS